MDPNSYVRVRLLKNLNMFQVMKDMKDNWIRYDFVFIRFIKHASWRKDCSNKDLMPSFVILSSVVRIMGDRKTSFVVWVRYWTMVVFHKL